MNRKEKLREVGAVKYLLLLLLVACGQPPLGTTVDCEERTRICDLTPEVPGFPVMECVHGRWEVADDCLWRCWDSMQGEAYCDEEGP